MAFSPVANIQNGLGKFLTIYFSEGVRSQISKDYSDWEMIKQVREGDPQGRQINFSFQNSLGVSAIAYRNPNFSSSFPTGQRISSSEHTAYFKELEATIELEYNLWFALNKSPKNKYADLLAMELESKAIGLKRRMAADLYGDGSGVVGEIEGTTATVSAGSFVITMSDADTAFGHIGNFEYDDILVMKAQAGSAATHTLTVSAGTIAYFKVVSRDRRNNKITLKPLDSSLAELTATGGAVVDGEVFYRYQQETFPNLASVADWAQAAESMAGLESLAAADGRVVHGITMSGSRAATELDAGGNPLDVSYVDQVMNDVKIAAGRGSYKWKKMCMAPEARSAFIESRESDRRFNSVQDGTRGVNKFVYQHEEDALETYTSEYIKRKRIWMLPENKSSGGKVLEYHGTDFEPVRAKDGDSFMLAPGTNGLHQRKMVSYLHSQGVLICKHPAAIAKLRNFTV